jgi:hypothetical protein
VQIKSRHYPHPVLSSFSEALVGCEFKTEFVPTVEKQNYQFQMTFSLTSEDLLQRIHDGQAAFATHVECLGTRVRQLHQAQQTTLTIDYPSEQLDGRVEISTFIVATESFEYRSKDFHPDYEDAVFSIFKGDVLAVGPQYRFVPPKEMDPLIKLPSIFTVSLDSSKDARDFDLALDGPKIVIRLSRPNFELYQTLAQSPSLHQVLSSLLILPAITSLLEEIRKPDAAEHYEDKRWYQKLQLRLRALGINLHAEESLLWMAQQIIGQPLNGALQGIKEIALAAGGGGRE